jgi:thiamine pyrophosphokinase
MKPPYVDTKHPVTLFGGSKVNLEVVNQALHLAPILIAADGGARVALGLGHIPRAVIGDFDSIDADTIAQIPSGRLHQLKEQDSTDFDKCLRNIKAPLILGVGFTGGRLDHELAAYNALVRHPDKRCVLLGEVDLCFVVPDKVRLELPVGTRVSLFPLTRCHVTTTGLRWSFTDMEMAPDGKIGTSNEASADVVEVQVSQPKLLMILPLAHLDAVIAALA